LGLGVNLWEWGFEGFGGEGDPVELAAEGMGAGGFEVGAESGGLECDGEGVKIVHEGFAPGDDDEAGVAGLGFADEVGDRPARMMFLTPTDFRVAPGTADIASGEADEAGVGSGPGAFALEGMEGFDDGEGGASHRSIRPRNWGFRRRRR
jgi:hypothetical protein